MRSGCFFKGLLFLLVLIGAWEGWSWLETKQRRLTEIRTQQSKATEALEKLTEQWAAIERAQTELKALRERENEANQASDKISETERRLTGEIKYLALSMREAVTKVRKAAIDTKVAELKIEGQATLTTARILKITDDSITFLHEDGVANLRVQTKDLPSQFTEMYDLGPSGLARRLQLLESEGAGPKNAR